MKKKAIRHSFQRQFRWCHEHKQLKVNEDGIFACWVNDNKCRSKQCPHPNKFSITTHDQS